MKRESVSNWLLLLVCAICACRQATPEAPARQAAPAPASAAVNESAGAGPLVVFLGDSLTAGYGVAQDQAYPAVVGARLAAEGTPIRFVNAGVSGDTSAGGLRRLPWLLSQKPDVVVISLGANDGLRGQPVEELERNLEAVVREARGAGAKVLLLGMKLPPSYGAAYAKGFGDVYPRLARRLGVPLVPFLLDGVAGRQDLNQEDALHPNAEGQRRVAENVLPAFRRLLRGDL